MVSAWAVAVAVVALVAPFAAAVPAVAATDAVATVASSSASVSPAAVTSSVGEASAPAVRAPVAGTPARTARPAAAAPSAVRGATAEAESPGLRLSVTADPMPVAIGGIVTVTLTVTNLDLPADRETDRLAVSLDWRSSSFRPVAESGSSLWHLIGTSDGYRNWPETSGDRCLIEGVSVPGTTGQCVVRLRDTGVRPFGTTSADRGEFRATAAGWVDVSSEAFEFTPLGNDQVVTTAVAAAAETVYLLSVENYDYLGIAAVGDDEEVLGRFAVTSSEVAVRGLDDAELVVRLSWPQGMVLEDPPPAGCVTFGASALDCTIDDANVLPGLPDPPVDYDDLYQRVLREWDLHFTPPASQVERERLDSFDIEFVSGWTYTEPIIALASSRDAATSSPHGASGGGKASMTVVAPASREAPVMPAASPPPPGGIVMTSAWAAPDSTPFALLDQVFPTTTDLDAEYLSSAGGDEVAAVFTVTHRPEVTTVLTGSVVEVRLDWPDFVEPVADPVGCTSYVDHVCTIEGLDEPGATAEITMEFVVTAGAPDWGRFSASAGSVIVVEPNSDGDIEHEFPSSWILYSSRALTIDDALVTLDVVLSEDSVWEEGPMLMARVIPSRAVREDDGGDFWGDLIVGIAITWPDYLTPASIPSGCTAQTDGMVCEVTLEDPGPDPAMGVLIAFSVGPGVTDGIVRAEGAYLQEFDGEESEDLPVEWVVPDEEPVGGVDPFIALDVDVERDLVWEGGEDVGATVTATRTAFPDVRRDPFGDLAVEVLITWPEFLVPTAAPTGCESWDGTICVIVLPDPGSVVEIGLEFSVGSAPPGGLVPGVITAEAAGLLHRSDDGDQSLPTEWVGSDEDRVTRIRAEITLDLRLDRDPGYTGGKQLVVTTTLTREAAGPEFPGLEVGLDFDWAGYLTRTSQSGCASFSGTTCTVTGLDEPGASAIVRLTFSMPPPTLPPVPEVAPRTDDVAVDGVALSFAPPPVEPPPPPPEPAPWPPEGCFIADDGTCVCLDESEACPPEPALPEEPAAEPEPLDGTLPPAWIGQDREPFTVLQPNLLLAQSVVTPGDGIETYAKYLPPDAAVTFRWEGVPTSTPAVHWENPDDPTQARWSLVILRWQFAGARTLVMHSEDGLFADIPSTNQLLVVPRTGMGPDLVGRGG
ncbi:hypothetical protein GCM10009750_36990 [Agromyces salentinus]|uniref:DUF11 domain-containing protein n=1 Tax=Agromyces salentinus TaxID=269421 RepID=A0ABN2N2G6_9MICO